MKKCFLRADLIIPFCTASQNPCSGYDQVRNLQDFMKSLTKEKRFDLIDAFNSTSRYLDDLLNINNIQFILVLGMGYVILLWHSLSLPYNYFEHMVHRIYNPLNFN